MGHEILRSSWTGSWSGHNDEGNYTVLPIVPYYGSPIFTYHKKTYNWSGLLGSDFFSCASALGNKEQDRAEQFYSCRFGGYRFSLGCITEIFGNKRKRKPLPGLFAHTEASWDCCTTFWQH